MATYRATRPGAMIAFASTVAGVVLPVDMSRGGLICQKGAFLCAQETVNLSVTFTKKFSAGMFGGEGFILQDLSGQGMAFLEIDGDKVEKTLAPGEVLKVDTGNVVAFEKTVKYEIETVKGIKNIFFGGEGLFLTKLRTDRAGPRHSADPELRGICRKNQSDAAVQIKKRLSCCLKGLAVRAAVYQLWIQRLFFCKNNRNNL